MACCFCPHLVLVSAILFKPEGEPLDKRLAICKPPATDHPAPTLPGSRTAAQERQTFVHDLALLPSSVGAWVVEFIDRRPNVGWKIEENMKGLEKISPPRSAVGTADPAYNKQALVCLCY